MKYRDTTIYTTSAKVSGERGYAFEIRNDRNDTVSYGWRGGKRDVAIKAAEAIVDRLAHERADAERAKLDYAFGSSDWLDADGKG